MAEHTAVEAELLADQRHLNVSLLNLTDKVGALSDFMLNFASEQKSTDQKFMRMYEKQDGVESKMLTLEKQYASLMSTTIPSIERDAAVKGSYWKLAGAICLPIGAAIGGFMLSLTGVFETLIERVGPALDERNKAIIEGTVRAMLEGLKSMQ